MIDIRKGFEKRFNHGDIVYWCNRSGNEYSVKYGRVDEQFSDAVCIDLLEPKETRYIDGVPIDEFKDNQKYRKLPKGWTYNTKLFDLEWRTDPEDEKLFNELYVRIDDPESIKKAYESGLLVKSDKIFHGCIGTDITKEGFRIIKKYPMWQHHITHVSIRPDKVYFTYQEAKAEVEEYFAEFRRQAALSDYEWAVEEIDKTLNHWKVFQDATDEEVNVYREWLLSMKNVEEIETRISFGNIQWKYEKNKKWNNIVL